MFGANSPEIHMLHARGSNVESKYVRNSKRLQSLSWRDQCRAFDTRPLRLGLEKCYK